MKKLLFLFYVLFLTHESMSAQSLFAGGDGSEASPYQITNAVQLDSVRWHLDSNFILMNDIDLKASGYPIWLPIGKRNTTDASNSFKPFSGTFDGQGHTISNINIQYSGNYVGFFAVVSGKLKNLAVTGNVNQITGTTTALLCAYLGQPGSPGIIENCSAVGNVVNTGMQAGVLVGLAAIDNCVIKNCYSGGSVSSSGTQYYGGLLGRATKPTVSITNCYSTADVKGGDYCGGIIGYVFGAGNVYNLYASGNVEGAKYVGGIAGKLWANATTSGLVALNKSIKGTDEVGRVFGTFGAGAASDNCWGLKGMPITVSDATYTAVNDVYKKDGGDVTEEDDELSTEMTYYTDELGWDFDTNWSMPEGGGYPILKTTSNHATAINSIDIERKSDELKVTVNGNLIVVDNLGNAENVTVYDVSGNVIKDAVNVNEHISFIIPQKGFYLVKATSGKDIRVKKFIK